MIHLEPEEQLTERLDTRLHGLEVSGRGRMGEKTPETRQSGSLVREGLCSSQFIVLSGDAALEHKSRVIFMDANELCLRIHWLSP